MHKAPPAPLPESAPPGFDLVWHDEFDGSGPLSEADYELEHGQLRNHEAQFYTSRSENVRRENGMLVIEARKEPHSGAAYTSASVTTRGKHEFLYGRLEVRARLPIGVGAWSAIWLLSSNVSEVGWPRCGEVDIVENVGYEPELLHATVHTAAYNHVKKTQRSGQLQLERHWDSLHVYTLDWEQERLDFAIDARPVLSFENDGTGRVETWPYSNPAYLIMNLAIGGGWGGQKGIDDAIFPLRMEVDYVRYYRRRSDNSAPNAPK